MKNIVLLLLILFLLTSSVNAINGYVSLEQQTMSPNEAIGELYLYKEITNRLTLAGKMTTYLFGFSLKDGYFPAGVPKAQAYDLIATYNITEDIELELKEGCKHYLSQSGIVGKDKVYIDIKLKYKF